MIALGVVIGIMFTLLTLGAAEPIIRVLQDGLDKRRRRQ